MTSEPEEWNPIGFLDYFMWIEKAMRDRSFAFILGAGASINSGVPGAGSLARKWVEELYQRRGEGKPESLETWIIENVGIPGFTLDKVATFYSQIYDKRFNDDPECGYAYLEDQMRSAEPSFGYSILAKVLDETRHKVVITTNFDNLVADALSIYTDTFPLVCGHESLTGFVRSRLRRPLVAKIHRDLLLAPKSDSDGTAKLDERWAKVLCMLLGNHTPIVIGYGGNDGSLMDFLGSLQCGDIQGGIFWCYHLASGKPEERIRHLVAKHKGKLIPIVGFDEFMLQLGERLQYSPLADAIDARAKKRVSRYREQFEQLQKSLREPRPSEDAQEAIKPVQDALAATVDREQSWWSWELKARAETDLNKREAIYRESLRRFPDNANLIGNFANFIADHWKNSDEAERLYRRAVELDPNDATHTGNFANFMANQRKNYDEAERLYRRALELDPNNATHTGNFANFMADRRKNYDEAERLYRRALELDPSHASHTGNLANLMARQGKKYDEAERLYRRALELNPNQATHTGNFALFMGDQRKNYDEAERLYRRALELDPNDAAHTGNFANFMAHRRKNYDEAERLYRRALELDPDDANNTGNFANFMANRRKNYDEAERLYRRALELDPNDANHTGNFANFMANQRENCDEAERLYRRALELDPNHANHTGNFANFMAVWRKNFDEAERLYRRALELDPKDANHTGNFAHFMANQRKNYDEAERLYRRALELDPNHANHTGNSANFMANQRRDYGEAERLYRRALELDPNHATNAANFAGFLLGRKRLIEARGHLQKAIALNPMEQRQAAAEVLFYWCLLARAEKRDDTAGLSRIKYLLQAEFKRESWSFAQVLEAARTWIPEAEMTFYTALSDAILDGTKVADLEQFERWRQTTAVSSTIRFEA